jgi:hypothetical protein
MKRYVEKKEYKLDNMWRKLRKEKCVVVESGM